MASEQANLPVLPDLTVGMQSDSVGNPETGRVLESQDGSGSDHELTAKQVIKSYMMSKVEVYRTLEDLRERVSAFRSI